MIYLSYSIVAIIVVFLSIKAAKYVDLLDKTTSLSGAFIGGILLSTVTSLPELLTSISATVWLDNPGLSLGNILGSNLFNLTILGLLILFGINSFRKSKISKCHFMINLFLCLIYIVIILNMLNILNFEILTVSFTSILIFILYGFGLKEMTNDDNTHVEDSNEAALCVDLTLKQIITRFIMTSIGLVIFSILITYITDIISVRLNLGTGFAGALFLGIATSLPEVTSCISLTKIGNFNLAVGNILGSNIFNFLVLFIADVIYTRGNLYLFNDPKTIKLLICGSIATPLMMLLLKGKNKFTYVISSLGILACYILFLSM